MFQIPVGDGSMALVEGPLDSSLPLVLLVPGMGGTVADLTAPLTRLGGIAFDKTATFPAYTDAGFNPIPPLVPVAGWFGDPPLASVTSWRDALLAAGFSTVSYEPAAPGGTMAPNISQLVGFAAGALSTDDRVKGLPLAILAHSRGGLVARALVNGARGNPALAGFLGRVKALITLHSPHAGSGLAGLATRVDAMAASLQTMLAVMGQPPSPLLAMLRAFVGNPALAELAPGSPALTALAAGEPVPGLAYHTFGGTSTVAMRLWQRVYTPDSYLPLPVPFPLFHWGTTPAPFGSLLDAASFVPSQILLPLPAMTEAITLLASVAAALPELRNGSGDILVSDAAAHLPFSTSRTTNPLNHLEALYDPLLQRQVITILALLRVPPPQHRAVTAISPFPASTTLASHVVSATDAGNGQPLAGDVIVTNALGRVVMQSRVGQAFSFGFAPTLRRVFDRETRRWIVEEVFPVVRVQFDDANYPAAVVDLGLA